MTPAAWERVQELFLQASDLPASSRTSFLDRECAGDPLTRQELEALLSADDPADDRLRSIVEAAAVEVQAQEAVRAIGRRIGPFVVEREIGRGGMGTVYLAFRDDDQFHQRAAIKLVSRGMDSEFVLTRFRQERQVLADLQHVNIARLLDGGATDDGLPYFAMEYLEGASLTAYCREEALSVRRRLELFLQVCSAVQYAHNHLVIHRDLKPGNILVGEDGVPKLVDFGIAAMLDAHCEPAGPGPATHGYASPEQIRGDAPSVTDDIYSLGAILRDLIFPDDTDLRAVAAKATEADPGRRYGTVTELAADIKRYLRFRPVSARTSTLAYRTARFVRRRRLPLLATAAVLCSLIGGLIAALTQAHRAEIARLRAEDRLTQMVSLSNRELSEVYASLERLPGAVNARKALVGTTLEFLEKLSKEAGDNVPLRIALARAYLRLGDVQGDPDAPNIGDFPGALRSYRAGSAVLGGGPLNADRDRAVVWLAMQQKIGKVLVALNDDSAGPMLRAARETASRLPQDLAARKEIAHGKAEIDHVLARAAAITDLRQGRDYAQRYLDALELLSRQYPEDADLRYQLSIAHIELGFEEWRLGETESAARHYKTAVDLREQLVRNRPSDALYRRSLMLVYEHYGSLQGGALLPSLGHPEVARAFYEKARVMEEEAAADQENRQAMADYAGFLLKLGALEVPPEGMAESLATLRRSASLLEALSVRSGPVYRRLLSACYVFIGHRLAAQHQYAGAVTSYRHGLELADELMTAHPSDRDGWLWRLGAGTGMIRALGFSGDRTAAAETAEVLYDTAGRAAARIPRETLLDPAIAQAYLAAAAAWRSAGDCVRAREASEHASTQAQTIPDAKPVTQQAEEILAACHSR